MSKVKNAGIVTAYGAAVRGGYTGTYEEFCDEQAHFAEYAQQVAEDKEAVDQTVETFTETTVPAAVQTVADEGTTQIGLVAEAGTTQIGLVQAEGATQTQAVEDKGAEVRDSIPQDYTDLTENVTHLNQALNYIEEPTRNIAYINDVHIGTSWNGSTSANRAVLFVSVQPSKTYYLTITGGTFDNVTWVEKDSVNSSTAIFTKTITEYPYIRNTNANTAVVAITFAKTNISKADFDGVQIQLELNKQTNYIPAYSAVDAYLREHFPTKASLTQIAPAFSTSTNYFKGQYCTYNNKIYRFTAQHNKTEWSGDDVVEVKPTSDIYSLQNEVNGIKSAGNVLYTGFAPTNTVLFTSDDVSEGDVIAYRIEATGNTGYIEIYDETDTRIAYFGKSSTDINRTVYETTYIIPAGFSYAKNSGTTFVSYITKGEYPLKTVQNDVHNNKYHTFVKRKACVTIIDDDGRNEFYTMLLPLIRQYNVPIVSAYAADVANWRGNNAYMTIDQLKEIEEAGGEIIAHGTVPLATVSLAEAEANVALCKANLSALGFTGSEYYVYPSGSTNEDVRSMISKYFKCAMVTFVEGQLAEYRTNRKCIGEYYIKRCHCGGAGYDPNTTSGRYANLDTSKMEYFQALISEAVENKSWLILYTHSFQMESGTQPTDGGTQLERLEEIIQYILQLKSGGTDIDIVKTADAFEMFGNAMQFGDYLGEDLNENMTLHTQMGSAVNKLGQYDFPNDNDIS